MPVMDLGTCRCGERRIYTGGMVFAHAPVVAILRCPEGHQTLKSQPSTGPNFEGHHYPEDHHTTGPRAWSLRSTMWCYPDDPCDACFRVLAEEQADV